jgi:hypothetical protein
MERLPDFTYGRLLMSDGTKSEPLWFIEKNGTYWPLSRAFTGGGIPESGVEIVDEVEIVDYVE